MKASSESGLCATVIVSAELTGGLYGGGRADEATHPTRLDLRRGERHNEVKEKILYRSEGYF
jgi:hypothetical protein